MDPKELDYYKKKLDNLSGEFLQMQYNAASMSNQITQLQNGYQIMVEISSNFYNKRELMELFSGATEAMISKLYLDGGIVLKRTNNAGLFHIMFQSGNVNHTKTQWQVSELLNNWIQLNDVLISNKNIPENTLIEEIRELSGLTYFIFKPFGLLNNQYIFLGGRMNEHKYFSYAPLSDSDGFVFTAVSNMIASLGENALRLNQVETERSRIARDMHDNIGSELSNISLWSELLIRDKSENKKEYSGKIRNSIREVVENLGNTVWMLNSDNNSFKNLNAYIREFAGKFLDNYEIEFSLKDLTGDLDFNVSHEFRHNIFLIFKEALFNAIKYSKCTYISIEIHDEDMLRYSIQDNGIGFTDGREFGNGLKNIKKRVGEIQGQLTIISNPESGTYIEVKAPINNKNTA